MPSYFCLTIRLLQPYSHGRGDGAEPEWPPSPLRAFQALLAAAAAHWNERTRLVYAIPALEWLEQLPAPTVAAAVGVVSEAKYRLYVPDNVGDKVAKSWSGGRPASIADYRAEKDVRSTHLLGDAVHYLFPIANADPQCAKNKEVLCTAARSITHLGWGVDMAVGNASILSEEEAAALPGERWLPVDAGSADGYRIPIKGTLQGLINKHDAFLDRLGKDGFKPVPPLSAYRFVGYARENEQPPRLFEAFSILKTDAQGFRPFDPVGKTAVVAGMVRHAAANAAKHWNSEQICTLIHGHTPEGTQKALSENGVPRFAYIPLPTLGSKGGKRYDVVSGVRRVLVSGIGVSVADMAWLRRSLSGQELIDEQSKNPLALLTLLPRSDRHVKLYTDAAAAWDTVNPVVLPGHDDCREAKTEKLLRQAIRQAGLPETLAKHANLEWRKVGFRPGVDLPQRYRVPAYLTKFPRYHVRIEWRDASGRLVPVRGPIVIGGGRFCGLGLFAPTDG